MKKAPGIRRSPVGHYEANKHGEGPRRLMAHHDGLGDNLYSLPLHGRDHP